MKKLFIHHPLFRLLSPLFSGILVYLLILLVNNNVEQLYGQFLSDELYFCITLSFIIQELSRLLLVVFKKYSKKRGKLFLLIQVVASLVVCIIVVTLAIQLYYRNILGFTPNTEELWLFNTIFCAVTLIYIMLSVSHQYLHKVNTKKLNEELIRKQLLEEDFMAFKNEINPDLLFNSLEAVITLMKHQREKVDDLIDHLAATYRYVLSNNKRQLVLIDEELQVLDQFSKLNNYLPYSRIELSNAITSSFLVVPGSLLKIIESIVKNSIVDNKQSLNISLADDQDNLTISYKHRDRIVTAEPEHMLSDVRRIYEIYSSRQIEVKEDDANRIINIPKLNVKSRS